MYTPMPEWKPTWRITWTYLSQTACKHSQGCQTLH